MGIIARQGILNTIVTYVGVGLGFITTIYLFPHILNPEQYGLTRVLLSVALLSSQLAQLGMKNTIVRYFPHFKSEENRHHGFLFLALTIPLLGFLLLTLIFVFGQSYLIEFYRERSALFVEYYWFTIPLLLFHLYYVILDNYVRALYDSVTGSIVKEVILRLGIILVLLAYFLQYLSFDLFVVLFVLVHGLQPLLLFLYLGYLRELHLSPDFNFLDRPLIKNMSDYSLYALVGGLTTMIIGNIDVIMLGSMSGLDNTAIYFVAFSVGSVIAVPQRSINKIAIPIISTSFKNDDLEEVSTIYSRSSLNLLIAGLLILVGVWANLHNLFKILPKEYASGSTVIIIIGIGKLFDMASGINGGIINISKHYRFGLYANLFLVTFIILSNYVLIPEFGIIGAAMASALSLFLYNLIKFVFVWYKFSMQPFKLNAIGVLIVGAVTLMLAQLIPPLQNLYIDLLLRSSGMALLYLGTIYLFNISSEMNRLINQGIARIKNRK